VYPVIVIIVYKEVDLGVIGGPEDGVVGAVGVEKRAFVSGTTALKVTVFVTFS